MLQEGIDELMIENNKKKLAFVLEGAMVGGIETVLTRMLRKIDTDKYEITFFTNVSGNPCIGRIPECIKIVDLAKFDLRSNFVNSLRQGKFFRAKKFLSSYVKLRCCKSEFEKVRYSQEQFTLSEEIFDCAIAYRPSWACVLWVLDHINAKKKVAWVHGPTWGHGNQKWIECVDKIYCVSESAKQNLENNFPSVVGRAEVFYNLLDSDEIITKAGEGLDLGEEIVLVTVARLSSEKGQDMIPKTMRYLLDAGYKVKWYLVGDGPLRPMIEEECRKYEVTENVILTGSLNNPYPYIKSCDIYVQTSSSEGYCTTTMEAKILNKPIVTTDAPGMREQFVSGENGLIVDEMSPEALFEGIKKLIDNPSLCEKFKETLQSNTYDNTHELQKLYALIEE